MILCGMVGTGVFMGFLGFADSWQLLVVASVLAGAASGMINPAQQAALADVIGNDRSGGQVLSAFQMAGDFGQILGPIVIGLLADAYGFTVAFACCGGIAIIGLAGWLFARETLDPSQRVSLLRLPGRG